MAEQKTVIIKLGGSIITQKNRVGMFFRRKVIEQIGRELAEVVHNDNIRLIIIHGSGSIGHQIAKKFHLQDGVNGDLSKLHASLNIRVKNQELDNVITDIFLKNGLMIAPVHTASAIIQNNHEIVNLTYDIIDNAFKTNCIPMLYGEMVYDETLGMTICSGDTIAINLAKRYNAEKIIFASDIDGVFNKDPHTHSDAELIESATLESLTSDINVSLSESHNIDMTGGLGNKITILVNNNLSKSLKRVIVCNGLKDGVIKKAFTDSEVGTVIKI